jgi:UDP-N-acetylglucosamine--N-acetylmuramyl-(pentapeptide) pyrophosphoryl-undecaprenol N-acetylglucosamine transferase
MPKRLRVCLAASGGGHVRQLLELEEAWAGYECFVVSEDTAFSRSVVDKYPVFFVRHFALGQAKLGMPFRMLSAGLNNLVTSAVLMVRKRPDVIISTGAGSVFFSVAWAKLLGAKFILIESFARFDKLSLFAKMASPFATHKIVQSAALLSKLTDAKVFDPLEISSVTRPEKRKLLFATVGATLPFDRMVDCICRLKRAGEITETVVIQSGLGGIVPPDLEVFETLSYQKMRDYLREADIVVCHGGTGSIITALREGCRTIVMPRQFKKGEHYDDHQLEIADAFVSRGLIAAANSIEELESALRIVRSQPPVTATTNPMKLIQYLHEILSCYAAKK